MTSGTDEVYLFHRSRDNDPFTFAGLAQAIKIFGESPVCIHWKVTPVLLEVPLPEEILASSSYSEGTYRSIHINAYERSGAARHDCLDYYGLSCSVCDLSMEQYYGESGRGYIHVHHLVPLASIGQTYVIDPIADLRPVCPNCHAMLHRHNPPLTIEELRALICRDVMK